jgi:hypothetical protein
MEDNVEEEGSFTWLFHRGETLTERIRRYSEGRGLYC